MSQPYYNTQISVVVRDPTTKKHHRISVRDGVPYITYRRKTRVLFEGVLGLGAFINVAGDKIYFQ